MVEFLENYENLPNELSPIEVAKILHCTKAMLYKLFQSPNCEIAYFRTGSRYWVPKSSLKSYILNHSGGGYHEK